MSACTVTADQEDDRARALDRVLTTCLSDAELENLVCVYLQNRRGYLVRLVSGRRDLGAYDYILRDGDRHEALVRAGRGHTAVPRDGGSLPTDAVDEVFVFSPTDTYGPDPAPNVTQISYDEIVEFVASERWSLPLAVETWVSRLVDDAAAPMAA